MSVVHDASSLLAIAFREPGADVALAHLRGSLISAINWSEVVQKVMARQGDTTQLRQLFEGLGVTIVPFSAEQAETAARLHEQTQPYGLAFADRACLALGLETGRDVYTADRVWGDLGLELTIRTMR